MNHDSSVTVGKVVIVKGLILKAVGNQCEEVQLSKGAHVSHIQMKQVGMSIHLGILPLKDVDTQLTLATALSASADAEE